ncbi:MAG: hypothetical protein JKY90_02450 [Gammaproteobacteria bacterium]|nr:hypothetical protein [Gammaproteobacteria bacterium]
MQELMASSGLIIVEIALVLIVVFIIIGVIFLRKSKGKMTEARNFVKKINANVSKRKESHLVFATESFGDRLGASEISAHVDSLLEKENSLYGKFVKVVMHHEGHALEQVNEYVDDLIRACHIKLPIQNEDTQADSVDAESSQHAELIQSLTNQNENLRSQMDKLIAENEKTMSEYEIIYEKHEALTKQSVARA